MATFPNENLLFLLVYDTQSYAALVIDFVVFLIIFDLIYPLESEQMLLMNTKPSEKNFHIKQP